ncbi:MAG: DUF167 domain-containing protein [Phycisphaerales bacterium]
MERSCRLLIKAVPGARRDEIVGMLGDRLKVRVSAPPEGGKANAAICALIAAALGVKPRQVEVVSGHASAEKTVRVTGADAETVRAVLGLGRRS